MTAKGGRIGLFRLCGGMRRFRRFDAVGDIRERET